MTRRTIRIPVSVAFLLTALGGVGEPASPSPAPAGLAGTSWRLVRFQGGNDTVLTPPGQARYTIEFGPRGHVSLRIDCNRGKGSWKSAGPSQLEFGPIATTRAACAQTPLNDRLPRDLSSVRSYTLKDGHLFLALQADAGSYEFEPLGPAASPAARP